MSRAKVNPESATKNIPEIEQNRHGGRKRKKYLILGTIALVFIIVAVIAAIVLYFIILRKNSNSYLKWYDEAFNDKECAMNGFTEPPLVIVSFDGFSHQYVEEPGWVTWLKKVGDVGVRAEKVFPVYPAKTFVNHYSIVTGLYSAVHGIVDNIFWDKNLNPTGVEHMGKTKKDSYWKGEPLWSVYQRMTGKKSHCYMWIGSTFNNHEHPCSLFASYNESVPFQERWDTLKKWLLLPETERPGLILLYFHEPDYTGHRALFHDARTEYVDNTELREKVREMDKGVSDFMQWLADENIINCVNVAFLSDHGMSSTNETIDINELFPLRQAHVAGTIGQIYAENSTVEKFINLTEDKCEETQMHYLISTDDNRPLRLHYSNNHRIGDVVIEGKPGTVIKDSDWDHRGEHGYDYLVKEMQTIFYARGPSFKRGTVLKGFQNIEYMNMWLDLLGLDSNRMDNNGTSGTMDEALRNPPMRTESMLESIRKCKKALETKECCPSHPSRCSQINGTLFKTSKYFCFLNHDAFCGKQLLNLDDSTRGIMEAIEQEEGGDSGTCTVAVGPHECDYGNKLISISADKKVEITSIRILSSTDFLEKVFSALEKFRDVLLKKYKRAVVLSGTAVDRDMDGIADSNQSQPPNLFFRLFVFCRDGHWKEDGVSCVSADQMDTRAFVFPLIEKDPNCLDGGDLLRYYSARVRDIELVTGIEFFPPGLSFTEKATVRTKIDEDFFL